MYATSNLEYSQQIYNTKFVQLLIARVKSTDTEVCIKRFLLTSQIQHNIDNELNLLYSLKHPNIIRILGHNFYEDKIELVLEYCKNKDLCDEINRRILTSSPWSDQSNLKSIGDLISALVYLQQQRVAHRDIKPDNILVSEDGTLKVGDLGSSKRIFNRETSSTVIGTSYYMSPELRRNRETLNVYYDPFKSDVWSLGLTFLVMVTLKSVEDFSDLDNVEYTIKKRLDSVSNKFIREILKCMICVKVEHRPDFIALGEIYNTIFRQSKTCASCQKFDEYVCWCVHCCSPYHPSCLKDLKYICKDCGKSSSQSEFSCILCSRNCLITQLKSCNHFVCKDCEYKTNCNVCIGVDILTNETSITEHYYQEFMPWCPNCSIEMFLSEKKTFSCRSCGYALCSVCKNRKHSGRCIENNEKYAVLCRCLVIRVKEPGSLFIECPICKYICVVCYKQAKNSHYCCSLFYSLP